MGHQNDDGNDLIRELLLSYSPPLICAVGLGQSLKDTLPLTRRPKPRSIPIPASAGSCPCGQSRLLEWPIAGRLVT